MNALESGFAELSESMADLEANLMHLQLMHESLARFSESFAAFLYGLNMNAFCVDFSEVCAVLKPNSPKRASTACLSSAVRRGHGAMANSLVSRQAPIHESFQRVRSQTDDGGPFSGLLSRPAVQETDPEATFLFASPFSLLHTDR